MGSLAEEIAEAEAKLRFLRRRAASATCVELGHDWQFIGGANCGCEDDNCSVPVHQCTRCGDCDYGENAEADDVRSACGINERI